MGCAVIGKIINLGHHTTLVLILFPYNSTSCHVLFFTSESVSQPVALTLFYFFSSSPPLPLCVLRRSSCWQSERMSESAVWLQGLLSFRRVIIIPEWLRLVFFFFFSPLSPLSSSHVFPFLIFSILLFCFSFLSSLLKPLCVSSVLLHLLRLHFKYRRGSGCPVTHRVFQSTP